MTNLEQMSFFLSMEVKKNYGKFFISQRKYTKEIFKKFSIKHYKSMDTLCVKRRSYERIIFQKNKWKKHYTKA